MFIAIILFGTMAVSAVCKGIINTLYDIDTIDVSPEGYSTKIYDTDGNVTQALIGQNANRVYVTLDNVPAHVQNAFIAIEDERFRQHNGIDIKGNCKYRQQIHFH